MSLQRLTYTSGSAVAVYRGSKYNPSTKSNFQAIDAKEFLVQLLMHVPKNGSASYGISVPPPPPSVVAHPFSLIPPRPRTPASLVKVAGRGPVSFAASGALIRFAAIAAVLP